MPRRGTFSRNFLLFQGIKRSIPEASVINNLYASVLIWELKKFHFWEVMVSKCFLYTMLVHIWLKMRLYLLHINWSYRGFDIIYIFFSRVMYIQLYISTLFLKLKYSQYEDAVNVIIIPVHVILSLAERLKLFFCRIHLLNQWRGSWLGLL